MLDKITGARAIATIVGTFSAELRVAAARDIAVLELASFAAQDIGDDAIGKTLLGL